jgi:hypothetical protein
VVLFASNTVIFASQYCTINCHDTPAMVQGDTEEWPEPVYPIKEIFEPQIRPERPFWRNVVMLNKSSFFRTVRNGRLILFKASLYDIDKAIEGNNLNEHSLEEIVPKLYHEFLPLLSMSFVDQYLPHRDGINYAIRLKYKETPMWCLLYRMARVELVVFQESPERNMSNGMIRYLQSLHVELAMLQTNPMEDGDSALISGY